MLIVIILEHLTERNNMRYVIFDLETRQGPLDLRPDDEEAGWNALREGEGGISVITIYDSDQDWVFLYDDLCLETAARHLEAADLVVSYYGSKFDIPVIEGILDRKLRLKQHLDLYSKLAEESIKKGIINRKGDLTLNSVCTRTFGKGKIGNGAHAIDLIKTGRYAELFNYCAHDVLLTRQLFDYICQHNGVQGLQNSFLPVTLPDWMKRR